MKRPVIQNPNKILRTISKNINKNEFETDELKSIIKDMVDTLSHEHDGVALAAPQIGINKRIFVISKKVFSLENSEEKKDVVCINPELIKISKDKKLMHEGCLSVRPFYGDIRRASRATLRAQNIKGEYFEIKGSGLMAEIFQHEIDHLDGILFIDNAINLKEGIPMNEDRFKKPTSKSTDKTKK
jgi:peptide deformylase